MRRIIAVLGGIAISAALLFTPASFAQAAEDASYLFVVDSSDIEVTPLAGDAARVVVTGPAVTRFTDRPEREAERIGMRGMLREFGWTRASKRLKDSTPNASISIAGEPSQIVDIKRARVSDGRVILRVKGITGPLESMRGAGSLFVDNAVTYPISQTVEIKDNSGPSGSTSTFAYATVVLTSSMTAEITVNSALDFPPYPPNTVTVTLGSDPVLNWTYEDLEFSLEVISIFDDVSVRVLLDLYIGNETTGGVTSGETAVLFTL